MMILKNKYTVLSLRILFGAFILFSGVSGLIAGPNAEGIPEPMIEVTKVFWQTGVMQLAKTVEVLVGLMFLFNFRRLLATLAMVPMTVGIIVINAMISPAYLITGFIVALFIAYFMYLDWGRIKPLLAK